MLSKGLFGSPICKLLICMCMDLTREAFYCHMPLSQENTKLLVDAYCYAAHTFNASHYLLSILR